MIESVIRVFIPFRTSKYVAFRRELLKNQWELDNELDLKFYLRYIGILFNNDGVYSNCLVLTKDYPSWTLLLESTELALSSLRIFSFASGVAFLELYIPQEFLSEEKLLDVTTRLRLCNRKIKINNEETDLYSFAQKLLSAYGKVTLFDHLDTANKSSANEPRPEMFVSIKLPEASTTIDHTLSLLAGGMNSSYTGDISSTAFYSKFPHIKWSVGSRTVCTAATITGDTKTDGYTNDGWLNHTDCRHIIWYILVLHQKYFLYQCMNDISEKETFSNMSGYYTKLVEFNAKYRFHTISEEDSHQELYNIFATRKALECEFTAIDEKVVRLEQYRESNHDKSVAQAMTIVSILCIVSTLKDLYDILIGARSYSSMAEFLNQLSTGEITLGVAVLILFALALCRIIPISGISNAIRGFIRRFRK